MRSETGMANRLGLVGGHSNRVKYSRRRGEDATGTPRPRTICLIGVKAGSCLPAQPATNCGRSSVSWHPVGRWWPLPVTPARPMNPLIDQQDGDSKILRGAAILLTQPC